MRWLLPLLLTVFACLTATGQSLRIVTHDAADCDLVRPLNLDQTCDANASRTPLSPPRILSLCNGGDARAFSALIATVRPDFYVAEAADAQTSLPGATGGCEAAEFILLLARQTPDAPALDATSTGVLPQDLSFLPTQDSAGQSLPPTDLSETNIRISGQGAAFDAFCATLAQRWQGLSCDNTVGSARNVIMISCPSVPLGASQVLANLFQASFQIFDWRDDAASCSAAHGVDVELGGFISWPDAAQTNLALGRPVAQEMAELALIRWGEERSAEEERGEEEQEALEPNPEPQNPTIPIADDPIQIPADVLDTRGEEVTALRLRAELDGIPIKLQFEDAVDAALCSSLTDLGFDISCDTAVSESRANYMMRCPRLEDESVTAFLDFIGLRDAYAWDWRDRHGASACAQDNAFEIEIVGQTAVLAL